MLEYECNAQFTPPARHDKTVLFVSCLAWRCELALTGSFLTSHDNQDKNMFIA